MGKLFDRYDAPVLRGKDITIGNRFPEIFISEMDDVICYLGVCLTTDERPDKSVGACPYYMHGKHSTDKTIADKIRGFYRLEEGCIILENYVDNKLIDANYKRIGAEIRLPYPDTYYGVLRSYDDEDEDLTRAVFGLTCSDLKAILEAYAKTLGTYSPYLVYPKLTRSGQKSNFCEMTDLWIPRTFPYIAFNDSGYEFSHVSLWGFIRHIQLLRGGRQNSAIEKVFENAGLDKAVMTQLFAIGRSIYYQTKVTESFFK